MTKTPPQSPETEEDRRRWSRRPESRPAEILKAAFAVFTEAGYDRTTIADVGKRAGVSPALVVHYFGTNAELFTAVIQDRAQLQSYWALNHASEKPDFHRAECFVAALA